MSGLGMLNDAASFDVKIPQSLDLVLCWYYVSLSSCLANNADERPASSWWSLYYFSTNHPTSGNDVYVIFHFYATQFALVRIHLLRDVIPNRISIQGFVLGGSL